MRKFVYMVVLLSLGASLCAQDSLRLRKGVEYAFAPVRQTGLYMPFPEEVPAGQYSGITYLGGTKYAVVHDKLNGGGLVLFDIFLSDDGTVAYVKAEVPQATSVANESGLDNEGVVFVPLASKRLGLGSSGEIFSQDLPEVEGVLLISQERDQTISEYTVEGVATGRTVAVPQMFAKDNIVLNNGFEALAYNAVTGLLWTTTERPLKQDQDSGELLRLQSFGPSYRAAESFLYMMDNPDVPLQMSSVARAYVHGVSAMTALDDGSLLVLEREVYVPKGGTLAMMLGSFTRSKIYRVNPAKEQESAEPLRKTLFAQFMTSALNIANYEGMCLGPDLPGGWHTLVLIADSQGGQNGLTNEYIKVITFK